MLFILLIPHRQIPYAIGQFTVNEFCHEIAYRNMTEEQKNNLGSIAKGTISLGSGLTAGVAAAVLSQPADTLLSQVNPIVYSCPGIYVSVDQQGTRSKREHGLPTYNSSKASWFPRTFCGIGSEVLNDGGVSGRTVHNL